MATSRALGRFAVPVVFAYALAAALHSTAGEGKQASPRIGDLSWLAGRWQGTLGKSMIEEVWTPAAGNHMLGMFRLVKDGKLALSELCVIQEETAGLTLFLRHFNHRLDAKEGKDKALSWSLTDSGKSHAIFKLNDGVLNETLTYRRDDAESLTITLEKEKDGKKSKQVFSFKRIAAKG